MEARKRRDEKIAALRRQHALNPRPRAVTDPAFNSGNPFFDANDLVQVKYEMLRRVKQEGQRVSQSAPAFGFSRPSYYEARAVFEEGGLPALIPQRPGPRRAHKLNEEVVDFLEGALARETVSSSQLAQVVKETFGLVVHPRSIERALARRRKKGVQSQL
ncbi:MAG: helix-turn-helix domain-containing protein [Terriglobia bacterium]